MQYAILFFPLILSAGIVLYFLPKIMFLSLKNRLLDKIDNRKIHSTSASRLGGASFLPAIIITTILTSIIFNVEGSNTQLTDNSLLIICSMLILYFAGIYDDIVGMRYMKKFVFQSITAVMIVYSGDYISNFNGLLGVESINLYLGIPLSIIIIVFITNAINLIDGIDGLASMLSIMAFLAYAIMFYLIDDYIDCIFCLSALGSLIPFWHHNVFGVRKGLTSKIFMGDGGALVIGFLLAVMAIKLWGSSSINTEIKSNIAEDAWIIGYTMLIIPCFDVVRVVIHRFRKHQPLFLPDKNHFHHKLIAMGHTPKESLSILILFNIVFVVLNLGLATSNISLTTIVLIDVILWTVVHQTLTRKINAVENEKG